MSAMEWRPVCDYEGIYEVSSSGQVRSVERRANTLRGTRLVRARIMRQRAWRGKYMLINLSKSRVVTTCRVHVLVVEAFVGRKPSSELEVCHGDGDPQNNNLGNLRWGTASENTQDKLKHGTFGYGESGSGAKLTQKQVDEIRARLVSGEKQCHLSDEFGVSRATICMINTVKTWK